MAAETIFPYIRVISKMHTGLVDKMNFHVPYSKVLFPKFPLGGNGKIFVDINLEVIFNHEIAAWYNYS